MPADASSIQALADVWRQLRATTGEAPVLALRRRLLSLQIRTAAVERQSMIVLSQINPLMAAGLWLPELVELTGGDLLLATKGEADRPITLAQLCQADPQVLVIAARGATLDENRAVWRQLESKPGLRKIAAVRAGRVFAVDARDFFHQPDASLVDTAEILAELLHRDRRLSFGHESVHWARVA